MKPLSFLVIGGVMFFAIGCGSPDNSGPAPAVAQTNAQAQAELKAKLDKANLTPEQQAEAQRQLNGQMQSTAALRELSKSGKR